MTFSQVVETAMELGTGARGLRSIMERALRNIMFDAPSMSTAEKAIPVVIRADNIAGHPIRRIG